MPTAIALRIIAIITSGFMVFDRLPEDTGMIIITISAGLAGVIDELIALRKERKYS